MMFYCISINCVLLELLEDPYSEDVYHFHIASVNNIFYFSKMYSYYFIGSGNKLKLEKIINIFSFLPKKISIKTISDTMYY